MRHYTRPSVWRTESEDFMITVRECTYDDRTRYDRLEGEYHYMGESHGAGDTIRLIFKKMGKLQYQSTLP